MKIYTIKRIDGGDFNYNLVAESSKGKFGLMISAERWLEINASVFKNRNLLMEEIPPESWGDNKYIRSSGYPPHNLKEVTQPTSLQLEVEESVISQIRSRRDLGRKKYGTSMERVDLTSIQWVQHALEECLDQAIYLEKLKRMLLQEIK